MISGTMIGLFLDRTFLECHLSQKRALWNFIEFNDNQYEKPLEARWRMAQPDSQLISSALLWGNAAFPEKQQGPCG